MRPIEIAVASVLIGLLTLAVVVNQLGPAEPITATEAPIEAPTISLVNGPTETSVRPTREVISSHRPTELELTISETLREQYERERELIASVVTPFGLDRDTEAQFVEDLTIAWMSTINAAWRDLHGISNNVDAQAEAMSYIPETYLGPQRVMEFHEAWKEMRDAERTKADEATERELTR